VSEAKISETLPGWMKEHLRRYLDSNGADGHLWDASIAGVSGEVPTLLLTTTGRRSGDRLILPLIYGKAKAGYVIVASKGGAPQHPGWYLNLVADPKVEVQVASERFRAAARTATGAERASLWELMVGIYPPYVDYQQKTDREIPVVVLEPVAS